MSGHSKWTQIKRQKGVADAKKGTLFTKLAKTITVLAREGGGSTETNFKLRLAIEKAKQANMPKENIERAIQRGTGEVAGVRLEEVIYEAFGPAGIALLIESITDNKNRTTAAIRNILTQHNGNLGEVNSVKWMFERKGAIYIKNPSSLEERDALELELIDHGAEDIKEEGEALIIYTPADNLEQLKKFIEAKPIPLEHAALEFVPKNSITISKSEISGKIKKLLEDLESSEEINNFYSNYAE